MAREIPKKCGTTRRDGRHQTVQRVLKHWRKKDLADQKVPVGHPNAGVEMSGVLEQFVAPYTQYAKTEDAYGRLLSIAVVAWNVTLLPEKDRQSAFGSLLKELPDEARDDAKVIVEELVERKEKHFSLHREVILDFEITSSDGKLAPSVISTVPLH